MEFYTLNQLINQFRITEENHAQLKGFGFGRDFEIAASEQEKYPLLWIDVTDSNIEGTVMAVSILVKVLDIQKQDRDNEVETLSDTLSIIQDIYAAMSNPAYQDYFIIQYASPLTPIREALTDLDNGWQMQMDFSFMQDRNRCQIPSNDIPFPPVVTCPKANILLNGESFLIVDSGATQDILLVDQSDQPIIPESVIGNKIVVDADCGPATANLYNTVPTLISTTEIPSGGTANITAPDSIVKLNGGDFLTPKSNEAVNISIEYPNGDAYNKFISEGNTITILEGIVFSKMGKAIISKSSKFLTQK